MNREKAMALVLLDLCAFACSQDDGAETRRHFDEACALADVYSLFELASYKDFVNRLEHDGFRRKEVGLSASSGEVGETLASIGLF